MRFLPVNRQSILVELADLQQTLVLLGALQAKPIDGVQELVPAARTILVQFAPHIISAAQLVSRIAACDVNGEVQRSDVLVQIPVRYDGEDLAEVAQILGISPEEVVSRHTGSEWSVAFTGFAPGFAYLSGGDTVFNVPRRATPRTKVPAGAVALAGAFSAVYPQASPGGWQIIGVTDEAMWDLSRDLPALLQPGYRVRFVDVAAIENEAASAFNSSNTAQNNAEINIGQTLAASNMQVPTDNAPALQVRATGLLTLFQDLGRHGQAGQGVSASGAMDQAALKTANRLVGNASNLPALETVGGGLSLQSRGEQVIAIAGAIAPITITNAAGQSWAMPSYAALALADGDTVTIGQPTAGARCYVAVRGGYQVQPVLGSAATDTLAHVGPPALLCGQWLGVQPAVHAVVADAALPVQALPAADAEVVLDVELGPRTDWFTPKAVALLASQRWQVTPQSNRVGLRLAGEQALTRSITSELPSEGTPLGAIQVPASGQPVLFLADHPLTGGYPVIGCVAAHHLDLAGQIPVGAWIRFNPVRAFAELTPAAAD
ncbi:5-oxoprolinase/urea amidolyase family protein [Comamonas sp. Y33R10-2]|uniref:5-oxoprolinase subunit B/C family protein n=1 Tax=Comamonas sp. Y33R10-2 TaxID=2853257 RepID=UPI001C5C9EC6|nr:urea amidolyase family protein [Comamonas sp. Y33R10-2]QXZ11224.1 5-oxoprolinase/urea amidolyase family protein [Comamonas sp. Y33R10-2]